ncbi:hypothetical protein EMIT0196MI5_50034 [Pseudomonas sp. IT-196MI5]
MIRNELKCPILSPEGLKTVLVVTRMIATLGWRTSWQTLSRKVNRRLGGETVFLRS